MGLGEASKSQVIQLECKSCLIGVMNGPSDAFQEMYFYSTKLESRSHGLKVLPKQIVHCEKFTKGISYKRNGNTRQRICCSNFWSS